MVRVRVRKIILVNACSYLLENLKNYGKSKQICRKFAKLRPSTSRTEFPPLITSKYLTHSHDCLYLKLPALNLRRHMKPKNAVHVYSITCIYV